jgi:hypothetical membrane protein
MKSALLRYFHYFGIAGSLVLGGCILAAMTAYSGSKGEPFSIFNHYISELGQVGVSRLASLFNLGLIIGGVCFIPFVIGLGLALPGLWAKAGLILGLVSAVALICVGLYPMNDLKPHTLAAMTFFRFGLLTIIAFGVAIQRQPGDKVLIDRKANWAGLLAILAYAAFLFYVQVFFTDADQLNPARVAARPQFWLPVIFEWGILFTTVLWFFAVGFSRKAASWRK